MTFLALVCLLLELIILVILVLKIKKLKVLSIKDTAVYPFMLLISIIVIFFGMLRYGEYDAWYKIIPVAFTTSLDLVKLSIDGDLVGLFYRNNFLLMADYIILYGISALALFSLSISLLKAALKNTYRIKIFEKEVDYLFDLSEEAKSYIGNLTDDRRKQTVMILNRRNSQDYRKEKLYLDENKIKYYIVDYAEYKKFSKMTRRLTGLMDRKKYYFVSFLEKENEIQKFVTNAQAYLKEQNLYQKNIQYIVVSSHDQSEYIRELIKGNPKGIQVRNARGKTVELLDESRGSIRCFDKYQLIANQFVWNHDFAQYIPREFINPDCTIGDCDINLYVLGFGKVNQALLKSVLTENQFVRIKNRILTPVRIETHIYDTAEKPINPALSMGFLKYRKDRFNQEKYLELPEDYYSHIHFHNGKNVKQDGFINELYDDINEKSKGKPQVNFFIISLEDDFDNNLCASKLAHAFAGINDSYNRFFIRAKHSLLLPSCEANQIVPYGEDGRLFTYDNIISDAFYRTAKNESLIYQNRKPDAASVNLEWATLSRLKQESNISAVCGIPFKLSLLGFHGTTFGETEYYQRYDPENERGNYEYTPKLSLLAKRFSPRDILAFSEHERWNAFEIGMGVLPMKKDAAFDPGTNEFRNSCRGELYHLCITTSRGLTQYYDFVSDLVAKYHIQAEPDVIQYDYDLADNIPAHISNLRT